MRRLAIASRSILEFPTFFSTEVFLIILESVESEVQSALEKTDLSINVNIVTIPCDVDWGTADSLRHTASRFTVSCN